MIDFNGISTPQLRALRQILIAGVPAKAENDLAQDAEQLCHNSPPKGYPKDSSKYGDSEGYRYSLDTEARCLAAWRYVHHDRNRDILGDKFKSVQSKIKNYAKKNYGLDLQIGESEELDWAQVFMEYYDSETVGERCDCIVLEPDDSEEAENMDNIEKIDALEKEIQTLREEKESLASEKSELENSASQVESLTKELSDQKEELETLREFKRVTEEAAEKAERLKTIKSMLEIAGIDTDVDTEAEYWLNMSEDVLKLTISKMGELSKGAKSSASIKVPQIPSEEVDKISMIREGLREMKGGK